jgi:hypothetical protein
VYRHWLVFWASLATVLTMFGIVPVQAGIFSTRNVIRVVPKQFALAQDAPIADFNFDEIISPYVLSTYSIAMFDERLPPWMARNYTLRPFSKESSDQASANWTAQTTLYGVDLHCELAKGPTTNVSTDTRREYTSGSCTYWDQTGYLEAFTMMLGMRNSTRYSSEPLECDTNRHDIFVSLAQATSKELFTDGAPHNVTAIFCHADYFQQAVLATVDGRSMKPLAYDITGPRENVSVPLFNLTTFYGTLNAWRFPSTTNWGSLIVPEPPHFQYGDEGMYSELDETQFLSTIAIAMEKKPLEYYMDPKALMISYAQAYSLTFSRAMNEALRTNASYPTTIPGSSSYTLESVVLERLFTHIVTLLLSMVAICAAALIYTTWRDATVTTTGRLYSDPGTVAAVMSLVSEDDRLLSRFSAMDKHSIALLTKNFDEERFKLDSSGYVALVSSELDAFLIGTLVFVC